MIDINSIALAGAPIIYAVIQIIRQAVAIPSRLVPLLNLVFAGGYVALAVQSGDIDGTYFEYAMIVVAMAGGAAGIHTTVDTYKSGTVLTKSK